MNPAALSVRQFVFEFKSTLRNRSALIFTLLFPVMFMFVIGLGTNNKTVAFAGHQVPAIQFAVPGIIAYGLIGTSFTGLAIRLSNQRDSGILKRIAGTPLPRGVYIVGQLLTSIAMGIIITAITVLLAKAFYGVHIYTGTLLALFVDIIFGSAVFCALALAVTSMIPNADAAPGIVNGIILPVMFISDIFYSLDDGPKWLIKVANFFPVKHLANSLQTAYDPTTKGMGFNANHLLVLLAWGVVGTVYAVRHFKWDSKKS